MLAADSFQVREVPRSVNLRYPPARPTRPQPGAHKVRVRGLAVFLLLLVAPAAWGQLVVLPTSGNAVGVVTAPEPGKWVVFGPDSLKFVQPTILEGGKACVFQGLAGTYAVIFLPPGDTTQPLVANVVLGGSTPPPPDDGDDDQLTGLSKQVRDWATALVPVDARGKCHAVAQSFASVASQIAAGTLTDPAKIISTTFAANQSVLGDLRPKWEPFSQEVRKYLNAESRAGRLVTPEQHAVVWREIAKGLEAVK